MTGQSLATVMIQCQNCGRSNTEESHFCRFCGHRMEIRAVQNYDFQPPRPYAWKTDEYQTKAGARIKAPEQQQPQTRPLVTPHHQNAPLQQSFHGAGQMASNYRCPYCGTGYLPVMERRISTAGWITFALLLIFTFVFFWIGLLMKETVPICPVCRRQVA